jgi:hypothetical protein
MPLTECLICSPFGWSFWLLGSIAFVAVSVFLAVGGGRITGIWLRDPVGPGLPLLAWLIVFAAPQMADMLAGMKSSLGGGWRAMELPLGVFLLGLQGWLWTRAAHNARIGFTDSATLAAKTLTWQERAAPRLTLVPTTLIAISPVVLACQKKMPWDSISWAAVIGAVLVSLVLWVLAIVRRWLLSGRTPSPAALWGPRIVRLFLAAPHSPVMPVVMIVLALAGLAVIQLCPDFVNDTFNTPSASLIALSCLVPVGSFLLAGLRDLAALILCFFDWLGRLVLRPVLKAAMPASPIAATAEIIGALALVALPIGNSYYLEKQTNVYNVPVSSPGAARPHLDATIQRYIDCRKGRDEPTRIPAIIVATEGGASRSAVWTLSIMRLLDAKTGGAFGAHLFAISSVSGGSLGAITYNIAQRDRFGAVAAAPTPADQLAFWDGAIQGTVELGRADLLSSAIADMFTSDMALGFPRRGPTLARAFEHFWEQQFHVVDPAHVGFLGMRANDGDATDQSCLPHLILNGTDVDTGNRLLTSTIAVDQALRDGHTDPDQQRLQRQQRSHPFADAVDVIYQQQEADFPASAAVLNSARFPLISPPGRLPHTTGDGRTPSSDDARAQDFEVIDGGVFDDYSGRTAWELADAIQQGWGTELDPIVVLITNDFDHDPQICGAPAATSAKPSSSAPPALQPGEAPGGVAAPEILSSALGLYNVRGAHARTELATLYRQYCATPDPAKDASTNISVFHFDLPKPHVEQKQAAPLNWVLDEYSCRYMLGAARREKNNPQQAEALRSRLEHDIAVGDDTSNAVVTSDTERCFQPLPAPVTAAPPAPKS